MNAICTRLVSRVSLRVYSGYLCDVISDGSVHGVAARGGRGHPPQLAHLVHHDGLHVLPVGHVRVVLQLLVHLVHATHITLH